MFDPKLFGAPGPAPAPMDSRRYTELVQAERARDLRKRTDAAQKPVKAPRAPTRDGGSQYFPPPRQAREAGKSHHRPLKWGVNGT